MSASSRRRPKFVLACLGAVAAAVLPSCGYVSDLFKSPPPPVRSVPEAEPNDTAIRATALPVGVAGLGDVVVAGDVDYWKVDLTGGTTVQVELFAARTDQSAWDGAGNVPRMTLYDVDGGTKLLEHDFGAHTSGGWGWGKHDLDFPTFLVPATGTYFIAVAQDDPSLAGGRYALRVLGVTTGVLQLEAEPSGASGVNDTHATAQPITPGVVHGFHVDSESDYYSFQITSPTIVRFEVRAYRNGVFRGDDSYFNPVLNLFDVDGTTLLRSNDDSFFSDPALDYELTTTGTYFVDVAKCCAHGDAEYFLTFSSTSLSGAVGESEPNDAAASARPISYGTAVAGTTGAGDTDFFSFAGVAGDMVQVELFDAFNSQAADRVNVAFLDVDGVTPLSSAFSSGGLQVLRTILQRTGTFFVRVTPDSSPVPTNYVALLLLFQSAAYETEPNDTITTANALDANGRGAGVIGTPGDVDVFGLRAVAGELVTVSIFASASATGSNGFPDLSGYGSAMRPFLQIRDAAGVILAGSTSAPVRSVYTESVTDGLPTAAVTFVAPASANYFVHVMDAFGGSGPTRYYVIQRR